MLLADRLKDQSSLVRELGDKIECIVWRRLKHYGALCGIIFALVIGFIAFAGIKTVNDVSTRLEPLVNAAEKRVRTQIAQIDDQIKNEGLKADITSHTLQTAEDIANNDIRILTSKQTFTQNQIDQLSKQAGNLSIRQIYPGLGQKKYVTFNGSQWRGSITKEQNAKWINIQIDMTSLPDFTLDQIESLIAELKKDDYTAWIGSFGLGGPYFEGFGPFANSNNQTTLFYFKPSSKTMASYVATRVSQSLQIETVQTQFVDTSALSKDETFVIDNSGLDLQLYLHRSDK